jgi:carbamoyltransferase
MDPRIKNGKDIINRVKNREYYRPFGASVLQEYGKEYFDLDFENPYMLYLGTTQKDNLQAITHVDGTCRAQTVNESFDYAFRKLLEVFHELSGCPLLLNTSLNEAGKPIAGWIENAMNLFKSTDIDVLVVGNTIYKKQNV